MTHRTFLSSASHLLHSPQALPPLSSWLPSCRVEVPLSGHGCSSDTVIDMIPAPTQPCPLLGSPEKEQLWDEGAMTLPPAPPGSAPPLHSLLHPFQPLSAPSFLGLRVSTGGDSSNGLSQQFLGVVSSLGFPLLGEGGHPTCPRGLPGQIKLWSLLRYS